MGDEEIQEFHKAINAGAPVPVVDPEQLKRLWHGISRTIEMLAAQNRERGAIAGASLLSGTPTATEYFSVAMRENLVRALYDRGVLREFEQDGELLDSVFQTAATMPMSIEDLGEATMVKLVGKMPPEEAKEAKAKWLSVGFDVNHPKIDEKFLAAVRKAQQST